MSLKLPKFPLNVNDPAGKNHKALFKPTGVPNEIKIIFYGPTFNSQSVKIKIQPPVVSWGFYARQAMGMLVKGDQSNGSNSLSSTPTAASLPLPASQRNRPNSKSSSATGVLPELRSDPNPEIILAAKLLPNQLYITMQSADPSKHNLARFVGHRGDKIVVSAYFANLRQWQEVEVPSNYKFRAHKGLEEKEASNMPTATKTKVAPKKVAPAGKPAPEKDAPSLLAPQAVGVLTGLSVPEAWGKQFALNGTRPNAPEVIVKNLKEDFPGRKTKWAKWVNSARARYNAGNWPGTKKPANPIPVYGSKGAAKRTGQERRAKSPGRRTTEPKAKKK